MRRTYVLKSRYERLPENGMLTGEEVARQLGACVSIVHQLGRKGILKRHRYAANHRYLYEYEPPGMSGPTKAPRSPPRRPERPRTVLAGVSQRATGAAALERLVMHLHGCTAPAAL